MVQHAVRSRLIQLRPPNGELQGEAITEAKIQGLNEYVCDPRNELGRIEHLSMSMAVHHSTGTHTWTSTRPIPLEEWLFFFFFFYFFIYNTSTTYKMLLNTTYSAYTTYNTVLINFFT